MIFAYLIIIAALILLLYDYRTGIISALLVLTNFGEFVYVNPNLEIGDFGGIGTIFFTDLFWIAMLMVILLKHDKLSVFNYKLSFLILILLCLISIIIPFLISSFSIRDSISVIRPLGNFLILPYFVISITDLKSLNYFEKVITSMIFFFIGIQIYEYLMQKRIPIRVFEKYSIFYNEDPYSVEFRGVKTGYIWSRIGLILPLNLFFGIYYFFTDKKNYGLLLIAVYILSMMITLSRIWIIGFGFVIVVISLMLLLRRSKENYTISKLFGLIGIFAILGVTMFYGSSTFKEILNIFLLRINSINDLADKSDSSFLGREYTLIQMISVWSDYPLFGAGFSTLSRRLITNDLGFPNIMTVFGVAGIAMMTVFFKQYYNNIKPFIQNNYILFVSLFSVMLMITFMSIFSIDMFYYNATGAMLFAFGNIIINVAKQES